MTLPFLPYGRLPSGQYGISLGPSEAPAGAAIEILAALPAANDPNNFNGRSVFVTTTGVLNQFVSTIWRAVDNIPVTVAGTDPTSTPTPILGSLYYQSVTKLLYVWDGAEWAIIGGQYAVTIVTRAYVGDGTTTTFSNGSTVNVPASLMFVTLDGVMQSDGVDYSSLGTNAIFSSPPASGVNVKIRSFVSGAVNQNANISRASYTGNGSTTSFQSPDSGVNGNGTFVYVNRLLQIPGVDYTITSAVTSIFTITNVSGTVTVVTNQPHNLAIGSVVTLHGVTQTDYNNLAVTVTSVPNSTSFTFSISPSAASVGTGANMYYTPSYQNDTIVFTVAPANTLVIDIRTIKNAVTAPVQGEANTAASVGTGIALPYGKSGTVLQFKSLTNGANVQLTDTGTAISIAVDTLNAFDAVYHTNVSSFTVTDTEDTKYSYIGVRNTSSPVTISLSGIPTGTASDGRRITICDESGGAGVNSITISTGGPQINGLSLPFTINTNYGYVTLNFDGSNYFVTNKSF